MIFPYDPSLLLTLLSGRGFRLAQIGGVEPQIRVSLNPRPYASFFPHLLLGAIEEAQRILAHNLTFNGIRKRDL